MASSFAAQLREIATNTTNELDLKAQRATHATSLIFEKKVAGGQDFDTIYQICVEGFQHLCVIDPRFTEFKQSLFSVQSKTQDRAQLNKEQNQELDSVIEAYLSLVSGRLLLKPAIKSVEWLVRRFRIHEYNTSFTILAFLPYYATPIFRNVLSILPSKIDPAFKFLHPYITGLTNPPRHAIAYSATNNDGFFSSLNNHLIAVCDSGYGHERLISFWTEIVADAVSGRIDQARSGRREIQDQREQDLLLKVLPTLSDAFALQDQAQLVIGCYAVTMILANRLALASKVVSSLMEAVTMSITPETASPAILTLCVLLENNASTSEVPRRVANTFITDETLDAALLQLQATYSIGPLVLALIEAAMQGGGKIDSSTRMEFVDRMLSTAVLDEEKKARAGIATKKFLESSTPSAATSLPYQVNQLITSGGSLDETAMIEGTQDDEDEEMADGDLAMKDVNGSSNEDLLEQALAVIPTDIADQTNFMSVENAPIFQQAANAFSIACNDDVLVDEFLAIPVLQSDSKTESPEFFSFFIRLALTSISHQVRAAAWKITGDSIAVLSKPIDGQNILPYALIGLTDSNIRVRRQVANLMSQLTQVLSATTKENEIPLICPSGFPERAEASNGLQRLSSADTAKILQKVVLPLLEECITDSEQILRAIGSSLNSATGHVHPSKAESIELKKALRSSFFDFLTSHVNQTSLHVVKVRLLRALQDTEKVGSTRKSSALLPSLQQWCALDEAASQQIAQNEGISASEIDSILFSIVTATDKESVTTILSCIDSDAALTRPSLLNAASQRVQQLWSHLSADRQLSATTSLMDAALDVADNRRSYSRLSRELLQSLKLSATALAHILDQALASVTAVKDQPPAKRRRTSQNQMEALDIASSDLPSILRRITFVLELIDSNPKSDDPELIGGLFHVLASLQTLKHTIHSELGYLLSLTLGCLLSIINKARTTHRADAALSTARVDLVIECARVTENPQVQNTALLLVAGLATVAPEHVLHSVMPIFTFMSSNLLKKDDEYSAQVINQAIDQIVPPLIESLRRQKKDIVSGTSDLLLSFAAAFEHMPIHRRLGLFETLIQKLGAADTLHAMLAMLANRYPESPEAQGFSCSLASRFSVETQLQSYQRYLDLVVDTLKPKPAYARTLLGISGDESEQAFSVAGTLLGALSLIFTKSDLKKSMSRVFRKDQTRAVAVHHEFSGLLEQTLGLTQNVASQGKLSLAANDLLTALLNLLSLSELVTVVQSLLQRPGDALRTKAVRLLENRLRVTAGKDSATHTIILALLPALADLVKQKVDIKLKHAAVACIDQITEKLGRKDQSAILSTARVIVGPECLTSGDQRLSTMALLCLSSMIEVLKDAVIPLLPTLMARLFELLQISITAGSQDAQLHNAAFALLSALLTHVPFMLSDKHISSILTSAYESANPRLGAEYKEASKDALDLLARGVDIKKVIVALRETWSTAVANGSQAMLETLSVIDTMVEAKPKSAISGNSESIVDLLLSAFDIRRGQSNNDYTEDEISVVEDKANDITVKMIYKLNDTTFRPLFVRMVEWATKLSDLPKSTSTDISLRQITLFKFLIVFFSTLKSIVTSYATYVLPTATTILNSYDPNPSTTTPSSFQLWTSVLSTLTSVLTHDADDFTSIPSNFSILSPALTSQLTHLTTTRLLSSHFPVLQTCLVSFATALTSSPPHLKSLNTSLVSFRTSPTATIRLASVRCQAALTQALGEEWLATINSGEMMVYIQRMLEDDDERVEAETREWVQEVQEVLGEDVGEMLQS